MSVHTTTHSICRPFRSAYFFGLLMLALVVGLAGPSVAQDAGTNDPNDPAEAATENDGEGVVDTGAGEEIVVTARKREENLQEVPVAVTVTTGEVLEDSGAPDISVLGSYVPNLAVYAGRNQSTTLTAFLRGIGQADPLWGVDPGVGLYLDDVYMARPQGALLDVFDVERVEVLRGPQGTLYGKNTIGGAIKYVSRAPTDELELRLALAGGNYATQNLRAVVSGPLVKEKLRAKLAFAALQHEGYGTNLFTGRDVSDKDSTALRLALDWLPTENLTLQFAVDRTEDRSEPKGYQRLQANPLCPLFLGAACPTLDSRYDTQSGLEPLNGTDSEGYSLTATWDRGGSWLFKSITAYRESDSRNNIDFDTTPAPIIDVQATYYDDQLSQELQWVYTGGGRFDGVFGLYYFAGEAGGVVLNNFINALFGSTKGFTETDSIAIYGDGSYQVNDRLAINFGLRVTEEEKRGVAFNVGFTDGTFSVINAITADYDKSKTFSSVAPKLGLDYLVNDDTMAYFSLSRGFKSGGFNVRAQSTFFPASAEPFDDEVLDVVELGIKSVLMNRQWVLNTAVFYGDYSDIQVSTFTSFDSDGDGQDDAFFGNFVNAGDATLKGIEVEFDFTPRAVQWFSLEGHISYLDAEPDRFLDANNDGFVDTQVLTNAPEVTAALRLKFDAPAFGGLFTAMVGANYRDESVLTNEGGADPRNPSQPLLPLIQDAYTTIDASLNWFSADGRWGLKVNGYNLGDEEYLTNGYNIPVLGVVTGSYGAPATVTAGVEFKLF